MKRLFIGLTMLLCSPVSSTVWGADFRPLDVKTGEWQTTMTTQSSGQPPIPDEVLNRLTPEQRAKMEAGMAARGARGPRTTVTKSCLTKDKLDKAFMTGDDSNKACSRTLVASSAGKQEIRVECNKESMKSNGTVTVEAIDSENVKGWMQIAVASGDHTMNMNNSFVSKWIGPACSEK